LARLIAGLFFALLAVVEAFDNSGGRLIAGGFNA
jgi:hypothetical protein